MLASTNIPRNMFAHRQRDRLPQLSGRQRGFANGRKLQLTPAAARSAETKSSIISIMAPWLCRRAFAKKRGQHQWLPWRFCAFRRTALPSNALEHHQHHGPVAFPSTTGTRSVPASHQTASSPSGFASAIKRLPALASDHAASSGQKAAAATGENTVKQYQPRVG